MDRELDVGSSETGSGRDTPRSLEQELGVSGPSYPRGPIPQYRYSQDELYDLEKSAICRTPHACLSRDCMIDGVWDPERWARSCGGSGSRGPSPQIGSDGKDRRIERDGIRRHSLSERSGDPMERLKEEQDGIILSPQRRSFGTGCHVSHQPLLQRALSNIVDGDSSRNPRRIGSGRIQVDQRSERDFRTDRPQERRNSERGDVRDYTRSSEREYRNSESHYHSEYGRDNRLVERDREHRNNRETDSRSDFRAPRDRYERDDRHNSRDSRFDRDRIFVSRRDVDDRPRDRDFRDFSNRTNRGGRTHHRHEEEPEWFTTGPISKNDTIELHGFDKSGEKKRAYSESSVGEADKVALHEVKVVVDDDHDQDDEEETKINNEAISVADRNGSLETNESSSPEANQSDLDRRPTQNISPSNALFDFSEFFKIENLPGLVDDPVIEEAPSNLGGSRFYQLYKMQAGNHSGGRGSRENSRRSSFNEEFGYLNDLLNGSKSPVIPSPPPPSANSVFDRSSFLTPFATHDKQQHIEFGTVGQKLNNNPFVSALINNAAALDRSRGSPTSGNRNSHDTEARLKALLFGRIDSQSSSGTTSPGFNSPLNVAGKVKTLAELEADLQMSGKPAHPRGNVPRMTPAPAPAHSTPQSQAGRGAEENDLTAFNKLISLMKAGAATPVESHKLAMKVEPRPPTPVMSLPQMIAAQRAAPPTQSHPPPPPPQHRPEPIPIHDQFIQNDRQADIQFGSMESFAPSGPPPRPQDTGAEVNTGQRQFLEAIQRNKEQQLQIRQAAMQNMRLQGPPASTGHAQSQMAPPPQGPPLTQMANNTPPTPQGMPVRRLSNGDPILNFLKANPTIITKVASPTPPPHLAGPPPIMQHTGTPRGPSPSPIHIQQALLSQQGPMSPRVPSPIMFSQQPPMHLSAPSPIHPSQNGSLSQSPTNGTNTPNSIRPPSVARVPSPQELIVHTQAILQNALIKKQLEDQKERFYKKHQDRGKSPNPFPPGVGVKLDGMQQIASTPISTKTPVNVAFTPTSVIRKMHSEKVQRRESIDKSDVDSTEQPLRDVEKPVFFPPQDGPMMEHLLGMDGDMMTGPPPPHIQTNVPPPQLMSGIPPPLLPHNQVLPNMIPLSGPPGQAMLATIPPYVTAGQLTHLPPPPHVSTNLPPPMLSPVAAPVSQVTAVLAGPPPPNGLVSQEQQSEAAKAQFRAWLPLPPQQTPGRPIFGAPKVSATPGQPQMGPSPTHNTDSPFSQRPIVGAGMTTPVSASLDMNKFLQQQQKQLSSAPSHMSHSQATPNTPYGIPVTGRFPMQTGTGLPPQPPTPGTNPVFVQPVMPPGNPRVSQQFAQMAAMQQARMMDPRMGGGVRPPGVVPHVLSPPDSYTPHASAPFNPRTLNPQVSMQNSMNCPISPGVAPISMMANLNGNNNILKQENANLMKWFGTDMLKTQLPTMPPLPVQGQRVMTVDEIERN